MSLARVTYGRFRHQRREPLVGWQERYHSGHGISLDWSRIAMGPNAFTEGRRRDARTITTALANTTGAAPGRLLCCEIIHNLLRTSVRFAGGFFF